MKHDKVIEYCNSHFGEAAKVGLKFATRGLENLPKVIRDLKKIKENKYPSENKAWYEPIDAFLEAFEDKNADKLNILE